MISDVSATRAILRAASDEGELRRLRRRPKRRSAVARVLARERADERAHGRRLARRQVAPARVEPLVARALRGPVAGERLEEVLARPGSEVEDGWPRCGAHRPGALP